MTPTTRTREMKRSSVGQRNRYLPLLAVLALIAGILPAALLHLSPGRWPVIPRLVPVAREARWKCNTAVRVASQEDTAIPPASIDDGIPPELYRTIPAGLPDMDPVVLPRALQDTALFHEVLDGGVVSEENTYAKDLWASGALLVAVRRPGCWMSREQAKALSAAFAEALPEQAAPGRPRLIAIVRNSIADEEGNNQVEEFRKFFDGEVFVDPYLSIYKALGDRQYTDGVFHRQAAIWQLQRMVGSWKVKVPGNFVGGPDIALKFGGCMVVDSTGALRYAHQEGIGPIDYGAVRRELIQLRVQSVSTSSDPSP